MQDKVLCQGGQGIIRRAFDNKNGKPVAIKFLEKKDVSIKHLRAARLEKKITIDLKVE